MLTSDGVISRITATTTVYTPAGGAEFPDIAEGNYPAGGKNATYTQDNTVFQTTYWDHRMYDNTQY